MRSRLTLLTAAIVAAIAIYFYSANRSFNTVSENEEEEGLTAFEMMGLWGEMRAYPNDAIPEGRFNQAYKKMKDDEARLKAVRSSANLADAELAGSPWTPLAPKNFAGRVLCLAFHPTNQNIMWAGSAGGGLWKTTNGGTGAADGIN